MNMEKQDSYRDRNSEDMNNIGRVIERFNHIELLVTRIIATYISPREESEEFVIKQLLNNSIVSFGAKTKLIISIANATECKAIKRNNLHRLLALRNAIAHNDTITKSRYSDPKPDEESGEAYFVVEYIKSDGSIEELKKSQVYEEFHELCSELHNALGILSWHVAGLSHHLK